MQRLHDKVNGNGQKFTTMVYEINKSRDLKKEITFEKKKFLNLWLWQKREYPDICTSYFLQKFLGSFAHSLNPTFIQNWMKN